MEEVLNPDFFIRENIEEANLERKGNILEMVNVSKITPMTFSNHALNSIMIKGFLIKDVLPDIYVLIAFTLIPLILFIWSYRRMKY